MTKDEALKLALEALEEYTSVVTSVNDPNTWIKVGDGGKPARETITAIKEALAQPEQEPVAFASHGVVNWIADKQFQHEAHLYSVPQRTWVGLTEAQCGVLWKTNMTPFEYYQAIEAKLKEKNT